MNITFKTRGNTGILGKQKVFISYDKRDRQLLTDVCDDILSIVDCAILIPEEECIEFKNDDELLEGINLIVLCVTNNYLNDSGTSPEAVVQYAKKHGIPILPILFEENIETEYGKRFSDIQYLKKFNNEMGAIPYRKKLSDYLSGILIKDELIEKIRSAFDAYIFLSYRKKDRKYAQELMSLIHSDPYCRAVAIWYDEYLIPGESFTDAIKKMIENSDLFTMVVTPNLLEEGNYVMRQEYPFAAAEGKTILPVTMSETDEEMLKDRYPSIPTPVDGNNSELFENLKNTLIALAVEPGEDNPSHTFFIGLAYLNGIDMEIDSDMGISLISKAAEEGLPEAARKMSQIYRWGQGVERDLSLAIEWQKKYRDLLDHEYQDIYDNSIHILIDAEYDLADMELEIGRIKDARNTCWRGLYLCRKVGRYDFYTEERIPYFAKLYMRLGDVFLKRSDEKQALECYTKDLDIYDNLSKKYPDDWEILANTCRCFLKLYDMGERFSGWRYESILECQKRALSIHYDIDTQLMLAKCYKIMGDYGSNNAKNQYMKAAEICEEIVKKNKNIDSISALVNNYIVLSEWCLYHNLETESEDYLQKAFSACQDSLSLNESAIGYYDLLKCYWHEGAVIRKNIQNVSLARQLHTAFSRRSQSYQEAKQTLSILQEKYPGSLTDVAGFCTYANFYEVCTKEEAMQAYDKALAVVRENPILYSEDYRKAKQTLWRQGKLDDTVYQNYIEFGIDSDHNYSHSFDVWNPKEDMQINVRVIDELPSGTVRGIKISEDVLFSIRSDYSIDRFAYSGCCAIQICKADGKITVGIRKDPTPDEYVYLLVQDNSYATKELKYVRCYG